MNIKKFNESDMPDKLTVRVKHIIEYLQKEFDPEAEVHLDHDGWYGADEGAENEIDKIKNRGIFDNYKGDLFINN